MTAAIVARMGERLWGANWAVGMSQFTGVPLRTLVQIQAADRRLQDHPAAPQVIRALRERLEAAAADLEPERPRLAS